MQKYCAKQRHTHLLRNFFRPAKSHGFGETQSPQCNSVMVGHKIIALTWDLRQFP